jgi:predicted small metal-binding protein
MKEFSCAKFGSDCGAILNAATEDRLAEMACLHLREAHGMTTVSEEMVGKIKRLFVNKATADAAAVVDRIFEKYNCDRDPECTLRYIAEAEMILTGRAGACAQELKAA